jgi:hypothetical protein
MQQKGRNKIDIRAIESQPFIQHREIPAINLPNPTET